MVKSVDRKFNVYLILLSILFILVAVVSLCLGQVHISFSSFIYALCGKKGMAHSIIFDIRLPRFLVASAVGVMLSLAGLIVQTIFRNPLVDPYFLGISAAAQLGVSVAILFGASITIFGVSIASAFAFIFSLILMLALVKISSLVNSEYSRAAIVLIGIAISYVLSAVNNFLSMFRKDIFLSSTFWSLKGFNNAEIGQFVFALPFLIFGFFYLMVNARRMNIYLSSDITAHSLGINLKHFTAGMLAVSALLTSVSVVVSGTIIFVGLFIPHIGRMLVGDERAKLTIITALLGATLLPFFDFIARSVLPSQEVPINVIASLIGAPFFIYLFFKVKQNAVYKN